MEVRTGGRGYIRVWGEVEVGVSGLVCGVGV